MSTTLINNHGLEVVENPALSYKAKGLFWIIKELSTENITVQSLVKHTRDGRDSVRAAFNELRDAGYIKTQQIKEENGRFSRTVTLVRDSLSTPFPGGHE